ncbi:MAG: hypothetical protein ACYDDF_06545 [Thermoplasmatota archaeon]
MSRLPGLIVKLVGYVLLATVFLSPAMIFEALATQDAFLAFLAFGAILGCLIVIYGYPAYTRGERWSVPLLSVVGSVLVLIGPVRFITAAAAQNNPATPALPIQPNEQIMMILGVIYLYFLLSPESREGMRRARLAQPPTPGRYICPGCGRVFRLKVPPPLGTLCPNCRRAGRGTPAPARSP